MAESAAAAKYRQQHAEEMYPKSYAKYKARKNRRQAINRKK